MSAKTALNDLFQNLLKLRLVTQSQIDECRGALNGQSDPEDVYSFLERKSYLTALQIDKLRKGDRHGYFLGSYRLLYKIASGSFGRVYRADDPATGRVVAIKVLRNRWSDKPETIELFEREGRVGMTLRHPNIVEILSVGKDQKTGQYYLVMEFVEGGNLRDILAIRKKYEVAEALRIIEDVAAALTYAFSRGLTHRDMKLSNVLIASQGIAKVVDFGLAQIFSSEQFGNDDDTQVARTVDYAGLEKATGAPFGDVRSDIYFIGCVAYEIVSGRPPLQPTKNKYERMSKERFLRVPPLKREELQIPAAASVIRLIEKMMAIDPEQRYQTPAQLLDAIRRTRAEVGGVGGAKDGPGTRVAPMVFVVEADPRIQDALREKLRKLGYKVLLAGDPARAIDRYNQTPFQVLIVDLDTTLEDGAKAINKVRGRAREEDLKCPCVALISAEHRRVLKLLNEPNDVHVLTRPLKMNALVDKLRELAPPPEDNHNV